MQNGVDQGNELIIVVAIVVGGLVIRVVIEELRPNLQVLGYPKRYAWYSAWRSRAATLSRRCRTHRGSTPYCWGTTQSSDNWRHRTPPPHPAAVMIRRLHVCRP